MNSSSSNYRFPITKDLDNLKIEIRVKLIYKIVPIVPMFWSPAAGSGARILLYFVILIG